jgi:hypothetical protein
MNSAVFFRNSTRKDLELPAFERAFAPKDSDDELITGFRGKEEKGGATLVLSEEQKKLRDSCRYF